MRRRKLMILIIKTLVKPGRWFYTFFIKDLGSYDFDPGNNI